MECCKCFSFFPLLFFLFSFLERGRQSLGTKACLEWTRNFDKGCRTWFGSPQSAIECWECCNLFPTGMLYVCAGSVAKKAPTAHPGWARVQGSNAACAASQFCFQNVDVVRMVPKPQKRCLWGPGMYSACVCSPYACVCLYLNLQVCGKNLHLFRC
jgi:hypothetical protein